MSRLKCFDNVIQAGALLASKITNELCKTAEIETFESGRTIIKQDHRPEAFYFIITGNVGVYKTREDEQGKTTTFGVRKKFLFI